ncbi:hypothetical protein IKF03_00430 [Candidatus Saccharibacteria bacterium]|nr:hypothetical protein [Candidatus Saccharibacteria bacterium]
MGIHTEIYRERDLRPDNWDKYSIKLFKDKKEVGLSNPVSVRELFYFGKSVWAINEWFYQREIKECKKYGFKPDEDLSYECMFDKIIYLDDLKELLKDVKKALANPERAKEVMPMPKKVKAGYDEYYFESLRRAKELLEQLTREDEENKTDLYFDYILDIG